MPVPAPRAGEGESEAPDGAPAPPPRPEEAAEPGPGAPVAAPAPPPAPAPTSAETADAAAPEEVPDEAERNTAQTPPDTTAPRSPYAVVATPLPPVRPGLAGSSLIGIFALTTGRTALMRFPGGEVRRLSVGDEVDGWRVDSISRDSLRLARNGRERTFMLVGN